MQPTSSSWNSSKTILFHQTCSSTGKRRDVGLLAAVAGPSSPWHSHPSSSGCSRKRLVFRRRLWISAGMRAACPCKPAQKPTACHANNVPMRILLLLKPALVFSSKIPSLSCIVAPSTKVVSILLVTAGSAVILGHPATGSLLDPISWTQVTKCAKPCLLIPVVQCSTAPIFCKHPLLE